MPSELRLNIFQECPKFTTSASKASWIALCLHMRCLHRCLLMGRTSPSRRPQPVSPGCRSPSEVPAFETEPRAHLCRRGQSRGRPPDRPVGVVVGHSFVVSFGFKKKKEKNDEKRVFDNKGAAFCFDLRSFTSTSITCDQTM